METPESRNCFNLRPEDVPGAVLRGDRSIEDNSNLELQRWLECRGLKKCGNKAELVQRVINCFNAGRENAIVLGVDGGKWYDAKRNSMLNASGSSSSSSGTALMSLKWENFPSQGIPKYFNKGHIYTYIVGIQFESEDYTVSDANGSTTEKPFRRGSQYARTGTDSTSFRTK